MCTLLSDISNFFANSRTPIPFYSLLVMVFMLGACDSDNNTPEELPTASFTASEQEVSEGTDAELVVQLDGVSSEEILVPFTVTSNANLSDYVITQSPLTILADSMSATIEISSIDDNLTGEPTDTIFVTLDDPSNAELGDPLTFMLTVIDND